MEARQIGRAFFARPTLEVARALLGVRLVRLEAGQRLAGFICETEAYIGQADLGCHAKAGLTARTRVMFGPPGCAYVYFTYGQHWMLNCVTEPEGFPAAVLIRAIQPVEGIERMAARRAGRPRRNWTDGPAKVCQALAITGEFNGADLTVAGARLFLETGIQIPDERVTCGPRVGLNTVPEPWKSMPWRFRIFE
jgi:DNA-3-methyladenine glycosylase